MPASAEGSHDPALIHLQHPPEAQEAGFRHQVQYGLAVGSVTGSVLPARLQQRPQGGEGLQRRHAVLLKVEAGFASLVDGELYLQAAVLVVVRGETGHEVVQEHPIREPIHLVAQ